MNTVTNTITGGQSSDLLSDLTSSLSSIAAPSDSSTTSLNSLFQTALLTAAAFEQIPVSDLAYSIESLRQTGLLKRYNLITDDTLKSQSAPPEGTEAATGQCYTPSLSADLVTWTGGMTCCIPTSSLQSGTKNPPYLGGVETLACQATIMSKGSSFDGSYCATTPYSNSPCGLTKYKVSDTSVIIEAYLKHNEAMNNVICRCLITADGNATLDVGYDIDVSAVDDAQDSIGAQTATIFASLSSIINTSTVISSAQIINSAASLLGWSDSSAVSSTQSSDGASTDAGLIDLGSVSTTSADSALQIGSALGSLSTLFVNNAVSPALAQSLSSGGTTVTAESVGSVNSGSNGAQLYSQGAATFVSLFNSAASSLAEGSTLSTFGADAGSLLKSLFGLSRRRLESKYSVNRRRLQGDHPLSIDLPEIHGVTEEDKEKARRLQMLSYYTLGLIEAVAPDAGLIDFLGNATSYLSRVNAQSSTTLNGGEETNKSYLKRVKSEKADQQNADDMIAQINRDNLKAIKGQIKREKEEQKKEAKEAKRATKKN